jgi:hypothetical protein
MIGNQVLGIKKLFNIKSIVVRERVQCSVVMQLQRMGSSEIVVLEILATSSTDSIPVAPPKHELRQVNSKVERSNISKSLIVVLTPSTDDLKPLNTLRPEPKVFKTSTKACKDKLLYADLIRWRSNSACAARKQRISSEASRIGASDSTVAEKHWHI